MADLVLLYSPISDQESAIAVGRRLVERRLAACANCLPGMRSVYEWQGSICCDDECLLLVKTDTAHEAAAREALLAEHPYETPCVLSLPVAATNTAFANWVGGQLA